MPTLPGRLPHARAAVEFPPNAKACGDWRSPIKHNFECPDRYPTWSGAAQDTAEGRREEASATDQGGHFVWTSGAEINFAAHISGFVGHARRGRGSRSDSPRTENRSRRSLKPLSRAPQRSRRHICVQATQLALMSGAAGDGVASRHVADDALTIRSLLGQSPVGCPRTSTAGLGPRRR